MDYIYFLSAMLLTTHLLVLLLVWLWLIFRTRKYLPLEDFEKVSILIAARNEEKNILECLEALNKLNYPKEYLEIIIGNDQSEDQTKKVIEKFIADKKQFQLLDISGNLGLAKGKANALAQMAHQASGKYFFISDADVRVPEDWVQTLLPFIQYGKNIVSGTTIVRTNSGWQQLQQWEWLFLYTLNSFMQDFQEITCSGNNMALSAEAYWESGGYENIEFSVTEDYQLFLSLKRKGYHHIQLFEANATARSAPTYQFKDLLDQRKRWISGGKGLPLLFWVLMSIYGLFLPSILFMLFADPLAALKIISIKLLLELIIFRISSQQVTSPLKWILFPVYELYAQVINISNVINLILPGKVKWKGRTF